MMARLLPNRNAWAAPLGALGFLSAVSCASAPATGPALAELKPWSGFDDCFQRSVSVPAGGADRMAQTCAGDTAAGDPSRSGIVRANAYFNAASAYNVLAASGQASALCPDSATCSQTALDLIGKSIASQQDSQIRPVADASQNAANERFMVRRKLEQARALRGAATATVPASCGTRTACLTTAADLLGPLDAEAGLASDDKAAAKLSCELLDVRWRVNSDIGREREYRYVDDLRRSVQACPGQAAQASARLSEISFERAERVRESLGGEPAPSVEAALGAITDYRDASSAAQFKLPATRGMGAVYRKLAAMDPSGAQSYLTSATDAFGGAVTLGAQSEPADARASDLEQLGMSLIDLAHVTGRPGSPERRDVFVRAADALQKATNIAATPARSLALGEAYAETGQFGPSIAAYKSAIAGLTGAQKAGASLALAGVLDQSGDPAGALQALEQAAAQGAGSPEVQYEIGRREFVNGKLSQSLVALRPVINGLGGSQAADAHYMISVAESALRTPDWQKRALDHAERAVALNARPWEYVRQACLATILKGGKTVKEGTSLLRCPDEETPEAKLLRGMYYLKQAQSMDVSAYNLASQTNWRAVLRSAEDAFISGQDALQNARDGERLVWFDDLQANVDVEARLKQGLTLVQRCTREITIEPGNAAWKDLDAFFGYYGVLKCS
ncbi:MAG TPA: hypothetical protein P5341_03940 [Hyphomonas sp.]|nr:hypothetical protein [Hyphomonas sp.]